MLSSCCYTNAWEERAGWFVPGGSNVLRRILFESLGSISGCHHRLISLLAPNFESFFQNSYHSNNNSSHIFIFMAFVCLRQRTKMMYSNFGATGGETFLVSWAYINFYMPWKQEMDPLLSLLNLSICPVILVCCEILDTQPYTTIKPKLMLSLNV